MKIANAKTARVRRLGMGAFGTVKFVVIRYFEFISAQHEIGECYTCDKPGWRCRAKSHLIKKVKTISEVLSEQGAGKWCAPKAKPHPAHVWIRKAFDTVFE